MAKAILRKRFLILVLHCPLTSCANFIFHEAVLILVHKLPA